MDIWRSQFLHQPINLERKLGEQSLAHLLLTVVGEEAVHNFEDLRQDFVLVFLFEPIDFILDIALAVEDREFVFMDFIKEERIWFAQLAFKALDDVGVFELLGHR